MSSYVDLCLFLHYRRALVLYYTLVHPEASVGYVQTILTDAGQVFLQLVPLLPYPEYPCFGLGPFLYDRTKQGKKTPPMLFQHSRSQARAKEEGCVRLGEPT